MTDMFRAMTPQVTECAVMSYNRGPHLRVALESLRRHGSNLRVVIYDDGSDDPETLEVLNQASAWAGVWRRDRTLSDVNENWKVGGLYANMNRAVSEAIRRGCDYLLVTQDDIQFVRRLDDDFYRSCNAIWREHRQVAQIREVFMRDPAISSDMVASAWIASDSAPCLIRREPMGLLDTGFLSLGRLTAAGFSFGGDETANAERSIALGLRSVYHRFPVAMWLPWPRTNARRLSPGRRLLNAITDAVYRAGVHPFRDMSQDLVQELRSGSVGVLPYAETYLRVDKGEGLARPWHYENSYAYPLHRAKEWLRRKGLWDRS